MSTFLPFTRPSITEDEIATIVAVLRSGWITAGPRVAEFEADFAAYTGARHAVTLSSATAGFHLLLKALGIGPGDEVITPSLTWPSAVNMVELLGARPVFADIDRRTLQVDPACVERAISPRTRAVVPVHFAGQPCDLDALRAICDRRGIHLIEDAAHAVGTEHRGRRIGGGGNPCVFSFQAIKNLTTAEGGMVTTDDDALRDRLVSLRFHGVDGDAWKRHGGVPRGYELLEPGYKHNLTDLQAAMGIVQLRRLEEMIERRTVLAALYDRRLADLPGLERPARVAYPSRHAWHLYQVLVAADRCGIGRDDFREALRRRGIGTGLHFLAVHELAYYRGRYPEAAAALPNTAAAAARLVSLPLFPDLREEDVERVVGALREVLHPAPGR